MYSSFYKVYSIVVLTNKLLLLVTIIFVSKIGIYQFILGYIQL